MGSRLSERVLPRKGSPSFNIRTNGETDMVAKVNLSPQVSANLLALERTTEAIKLSQRRLSTGLRVPTAASDTAAFFQAQALTSRSSQLLIVKDSIGSAVSTVETAIAGISSIQDLVEQLRGLAFSAQSDADTGNRSRAAVQFNDLRQQIDNLANDSSFAGTNLIKTGASNLSVTFSEDGKSTLTVSGVVSDASGLSITTAASNWDTDANINLAINDLDSALSTLRSTANTLGTRASFISLRLD
ncbi:MAG TPA: hypothetical protein EYN27_02790, partial [Rhodospirillales bacterium]|nr:hypothetical protein [Rhodospirillales bacterium]